MAVHTVRGVRAKQRRMKKTVFGDFLTVAVACTCLTFGQKTNQPAVPKSAVHLEFRALVPGEVIKASVESASGIKRAQIRFDGTVYSMGKERAEGTLFALVGLDLDQNPGTYPVVFTVVYDDGQFEHIEKEIRVLSKVFPVKKLRVDERYVTPPLEVLQRIREESEILKTVYAIVTPLWMGDGAFMLPSEGESVPNFGERRIFNGEPRGAHGGIDISSPFGTPVVASNSGKVVLASDLYFAGKTVIIDHGLGIFTLYCHFSRFRVRRGDLVQKGSIVGEIGATGRVTGPHLHWAVKIQGNRVDPFSLINLNFPPVANPE